MISSAPNIDLTKFFKDIDIEEMSPEAHLVALGEFIINGFLEYAQPFFPHTIAGFKQVLYAHDQYLLNTLLTPDEGGKGGVSQLAGVNRVLLWGSENIAQNPHSVFLLSLVNFQHILEVVSDNLDQKGLLSLEILQIFITVLNGSETLENAKVELLEMMREYSDILKADDDVKPYLKLLPEVPEADGTIFTDNIMGNLLYLNLVASKKAYDALFINTGIQKLDTLASYAQSALLDRYQAQYDLKKEGGIAELAATNWEKLLAIRTRDILTKYTYLKVFLAIALKDPKFREELEALDLEILLKAIDDASLYIRFVNDIGGLAELSKEDLDNVFFSLQDSLERNGIDREKSNSDNLCNLIRNSKNPELERLFYTIIKDINQNEDNMALHFAGCEDCDFEEYLERLKDNLSRLIDTAQELRRRILLLPENGGGYVLPEIIRKKIFLFMEDCRDMYANKIDFDSEGSRGVYVLRTIKDPEGVYRENIEEENKSSGEQ